MADRREIGPLGTVARVVAGVAAIVVAITSRGVGWWEWAGVNAYVLIAAGATSLVMTGFARYAPGAFASRHAICSPPGCALIAVLVALAYALSAITPADGEVVFWGWLGASLLVGAVAGYGGCEVLAFPNAFTGRRHRVGCLLFTPIDAAEARYRTRTSPRAALGRGDRWP